MLRDETVIGVLLTRDSNFQEIINKLSEFPIRYRTYLNTLLPITLHSKPIIQRKFIELFQVVMKIKYAYCNLQNLSPLISLIEQKLETESATTDAFIDYKSICTDIAKQNITRIADLCTRIYREYFDSDAKTPVADRFISPFLYVPKAQVLDAITTTASYLQ